MLQGQVLIIDTQAIDKLPLKKILFQGLYSTGFSIHRIFGIFGPRAQLGTCSCPLLKVVEDC